MNIFRDKINFVTKCVLAGCVIFLCFHCKSLQTFMLYAAGYKGMNNTWLRKVKNTYKVHNTVKKWSLIDKWPQEASWRKWYLAKLEAIGNTISEVEIGWARIRKGGKACSAGIWNINLGYFRKSGWYVGANYR